MKSGPFCLFPFSPFSRVATLGQKRSKPKVGAAPQPPRPAGKPPSEDHQSSGGQSRRWFFRLVALVLVPLLVLGLLEAALRLGGYGYRTSFFRPLRIGQEDYLVENDQFGLRFFPPALARIPGAVVMKASKAPGTFRIFILGESAALGDPRPNYSAGRYLEVLLREKFPETKFEVINTGVTAINSHAIVPIARECARQAGDCWIIYMGNNEMVGPFGAATVFGRQAPPVWVVRLSLALQRNRLGQLLVALSRHLRTPSAEARSWHGMEMFMQNKVPPGDRRREMVYRNFEQNLRDILAAGTGCGARILLNTVAVNLKDCPPFSSAGAADLPPPQRASYEKTCAEAVAAADQGDWRQSAQSYEAAARLLPTAADLQFGWAEALLRLTNGAAALPHFQSAVDLDTLPFRTDSRLNEIIGRCVDKLPPGAKVVLADTPSLLAPQSAPGIPGEEAFYEHVHLTFDGNYHLARAWAERVESMLPASLKRNAASQWLSQETCEQWLGLADWNRVSVLEEMVRRLQQPPFSAQRNNARRLEKLRASISDLRQRMAATPQSAARETYETALRRAPQDHGLHENFAEFLEATGARDEAAREWRTVCQLTPQYYFPYYSLGTLLKESGKFPEALKCLEQAASLNPGSGEICFQQGVVYGRNNQWELALRKFDEAALLSPDDPRVPLFAGEVLRKMNRRPEAVNRFREALRLNPEYWEAHYRLAEELALEGQIGQAAREFEATLRGNPSYARARVNLAVALLKLGRSEEATRQVQEALRQDPQNKEALTLLRQMQSN